MATLTLKQASVLLIRDFVRPETVLAASAVSSYGGQAAWWLQ